MNTSSFFLRSLLLAVLAVAPAWAQTAIRSAGVLGNSGEAGDTLVRFTGAADARVALTGLGVDADGFLWAFGGSGAVNRYSVDGRQLGSYPVPKGKARAKLMLSVVGNQVLLLAGEQLYSLPSNAKPGDAFAELPVKAKAISTSAIDNRIGVISPAGELGVFDVVTRQSTVRGMLPADARANSIVLLPNGALIVDGTIKLSPDGVQSQVKLPGGSPVSIDGKIYAFAWHSTIQRVDENGSPDPGVVLGGSSGSFIGTLPKDGEVNLPMGLVKIDERRFATAGALGVIHILEWNDQKRSFDWVRRIGAIHRSSGLGLDRQGRVWWNCGYWNWTDGPATYPRNTLHMTDGDGWQMVLLASDAISGLGYRNKQPQIINGAIDPVPRDRYDALPKGSDVKFPPNLTGAAVFGVSGREEVFMVDASGTGVVMTVDAIGRFKALRGATELKLTSAKPAITSLANSPSGELLAADGASLVRLKREGDNFTEVVRVEGWGKAPDTRFGPGIFISSDGPRLWVADQANNRVLLFTLTADNKLGVPAIFTGDPVIGALNRPQRISARGDRAVVVDWDNQRLVKLEATYVR